ncbi:hypothetical protein MUGA111182_19885 [Mucilaginibacter galii]|uniref:Uncharacterized protein n=1 Tax=Mucilaginibacter galii TaxID=2005073 RepID=A0A917JDD7_9SPHI|nr:hypothetical protein [Mucilaginibacter galii]GGI52395.1 hypothetical protein GCM10011425_36070 [Mucilaginibacter galii]
MVNLLITYDDNDSTLANYFEANHTYVSGFVSELPDIVLHSMRGLDLSQDSVTVKINEFEQKPFLFAGYSHGNCDQLLTDNGVFVCADNSASFKDAIVYTTACGAAENLGGTLINEGCVSFIGYHDYSLAPTNEDFNDLFIECENFALKRFITEDITYGDAFDSMLQKFDDEMVNMYQANEIITAMELLHNRERIDIQGDEYKKFSSLHV